LLRSGNLDNRGVGQALDAIERNAWLQSRLIDDLLDTSRIATGKLHFEPQPTDLNVAVRAAVDTVRASAASRKIDLQTSLSPAPLVILGEPVRLQQIAWNLISNAIKFTESGGSVSVVTERDDSSARLTVEDTGIGIAADFLPHVFDRFRQADGSTSRVHGGLGLGLAIANALAKMHGGRLKVKSDGVGHGSRFTLSVGIAREVAIPVEPVNEQSHSLLGLDVLIVEDSPDTLALLSTIFTNEGANVTAASSAPDALDAVASTKPDLIISDIGMPGTDGYQFLEEIRRLPEMSQIPAIAISGYASQDDRQRALKVGYAALIAKPIDVDALFTLIQDLRLGAMSSPRQ
jgi:CheY-like chemotaxis protein